MRRRDASLVSAAFALALAAACNSGGTETIGGTPSETGPDGPDIPDEPMSCDELGDEFPLSEGVATLAGRAEPGWQDGCRLQARFFNPVNVAVGPEGNVFVADFDNDLIRRVTPEGEVTTVAELPGFSAPFGLAFTPSGELYIETDGNDRSQRDWETGTIWHVDLETGRPTLIVRDIGRPRGIAALDDRRLVLSDMRRHTLSILDVQTGLIEPLAGEPDEAGFADGTGDEARFDTPYDVVVTEDGDLLVADQGNNAIRRVTLDGEVTTVVGGPDDLETLNAPQGLALADDGTLYITEFGAYRISRLTPDGAVELVAGDGNPGYRDGDPASAQFNGLEGIDLSPDGRYLYVADGDRGRQIPGFHRIRRVDLEF